MSLDAALSIAGSGLAAVQGQIAVVSQNVANANTAGYTEEVAPAIEAVAGSQPDGVRLGVATRVATPVVQDSLYLQNAAVSYQTVTNNALTAITSVEGSTDSSTGSTGSLTSYLSNVQSNLISLQADPTSSAEQESVVESATQLADGINSLASTYTQQRQAASDALAGNVATANQDLQTIGSLSNQIVALSAMGQSTASLEDQRQSAMTDLSGMLDVKFTEQSNGAMSVATTSGLTLPTDGSDVLSYQSPTLSAGSTAPPITLGPATGGTQADQVDVTASLTGGAIGGNLALTNVTIPSYQAQLDCLSGALLTRFSAEGLPIFADASGNTPTLTATSIVGLSSGLQAIDPTSSTSSLASAVTAGLGDQDTLSDVVQYALGSDDADGSAWSAVTTASLPYSTTAPLSDLASGLLVAQGSDAQTAQTNLSDATAVQSSLGNQVSSVTSVSIDSEMSKMIALQNSYEANAKVVTAIQSMYTALLDAVDS